VPEPETAERNLLTGLLNELALGANHHGVTLCLIPSGDSAETLKHLLKQVKSGPVSVDADLANWVLAGQSVTEELRALFGWIGHLEARDAARGYGSRGQETPLGRGEIDWDEVAGLLNEMAFTGWVNVSRREGADRFGDIQRGVQFLQNLFAGGLAGA
jgi:sugar phosphate isomerase/epimerase